MPVVAAPAGSGAVAHLARTGGRRVSSCRLDETLSALARLRPRRRASLVLRFYADLPEADIASALGCRPAP